MLVGARVSHRLANSEWWQPAAGASCGRNSCFVSFALAVCWSCPLAASGRQSSPGSLSAGCSLGESPFAFFVWFQAASVLMLSSAMLTTLASRVSVTVAIRALPSAAYTVACCIST